jgi:hypothetical protein
MKRLYIVRSDDPNGQIYFSAIEATSPTEAVLAKHNSQTLGRGRVTGVTESPIGPSAYSSLGGSPIEDVEVQRIVPPAELKVVFSS